MTPKELKKSFQQLNPLPSKAPRFSWLRRQIEIRQHAERQEIDDFLQWSTIIETMFVGNAPYIKTELDYLLDRIAIFDEYYVRWGDILEEPELGNPELYYDDRINCETSGNFIHQTYHIKQWEYQTGQQVKNLNRIVEIGGGYGAMCLICRRLGFTGNYYIIDLLGNIPYICNSFLFAYAPNWDKMDNVKWFEDFAGQLNDLEWQDWKIEHLPNSRYRVGWNK